MTAGQPGTISRRLRAGTVRSPGCRRRIRRIRRKGRRPRFCEYCEGVLEWIDRVRGRATRSWWAREPVRAARPLDPGARGTRSMNVAVRPARARWDDGDQVLGPDRARVMRGQAATIRPMDQTGPDSPLDLACLSLIIIMRHPLWTGIPPRAPSTIRASRPVTPPIGGDEKGEAIIQRVPEGYPPQLPGSIDPRSVRIRYARAGRAGVADPLSHRNDRGREALRAGVRVRSSPRCHGRIGLASPVGSTKADAGR
jgi:ribosomal protein L34E